MKRLKLVRDETKFDFLGYRRIAAMVSAGLIALSLLSLAVFQLNFGIDFRGGTLVEARFATPPDENELRSALSGLGLGEVTPQAFGGRDDTFQIRVEAQDDAAERSRAMQGVVEAIAGLDPAATIEDQGSDPLGAALLRVTFETAPEREALLAALQGVGDGDIGLSTTAGGTVVDLRVPVPSVASVIVEALEGSFEGVEIRRTEMVGAKVSGELIQSGVLAVFLAIGAVLIYIWLRFEWHFAAGAVVALVHDVVLTLGVFSLFGIEFTLAIIAAILTIVGYSLNDTVVVFDRVRENLRRYKTTPLADTLNRSVNETLSRTLMTSVTTLLALLALYTGGALDAPSLLGFTFAMIFGVIVGTYSSIYIAAPVLIWLDLKPAAMSQEEESGAGVQFGG